LAGKAYNTGQRLIKEKMSTEMGTETSKHEQSKEQLLAEVVRLKKELKKRKKYGLVWEEKRR